MDGRFGSGDKMFDIGVTGTPEGRRKFPSQTKCIELCLKPAQKLVELPFEPAGRLQILVDKGGPRPDIPRELAVQCHGHARQRLLQKLLWPSVGHGLVQVSHGIG